MNAEQKDLARLAQAESALAMQFLDVGETAMTKMYLLKVIKKVEMIEAFGPKHNLPSGQTRTSAFLETETSPTIKS